MATLEEILKRHYSFRVDADLDAGGWVIRFPDLPGCITQADTFEEVGEMAADAFRGWVAVAYEMGHEIPVPADTDEVGFRDWPNGRTFTSRSDDTLSMTSSEVASRLGVSRRRVTELAKSRAVGAQVGRDWLFSENDVAAMRDRKPGRPRKVTA